MLRTRRTHRRRAARCVQAGRQRRWSCAHPRWRWPGHPCARRCGVASRQPARVRVSRGPHRLWPPGRAAGRAVQLGGYGAGTARIRRAVSSTSASLSATPLQRGRGNRRSPLCARAIDPWGRGELHSRPPGPRHQRSGPFRYAVVAPFCRASSWLRALPAGMREESGFGEGNRPARSEVRCGRDTGRASV